MNTITAAPQQTGLAIVWPYAESVIKELAENYKNLVISDTETYDATRAARTEMVSVRTSINKALKAGNAPLKAAMDANRDEAKRLTELAAPTEVYLQEQVKTWEAKKEAEKQAKIQAERDRVAAIRARINWIGAQPMVPRGFTSDEIMKRHGIISVIVVDDTFEEFQDEARQVVAATLESLVDAANEKADEERQDAERKAETERLRQEAEKQAQERAAFRAEQAAAQAAIKAQQEAIEAQHREIAEKAKAAEIAARKEREGLDRQRTEIENAKRLADQLEAARLHKAQFAQSVDNFKSMATDETSDPDPEAEIIAPVADCVEPAPTEPARPNADVIVIAVAESFEVDFETARAWIIEIAVEL